MDQQHTAFFFGLDEHPDRRFSVVSFQGKEGLNTCYSFSVTLASKDTEVPPDVLIGAKARFEIQPVQAREMVYHGVVSCFEQLQAQGDYAFYTATLVPRLWLTTLSRGSNILLDKDIKQLVQAVLQNAQQDPHSYAFKFTQSYPKKEYICQYNETDFDFILRSIEHSGIYFYFEQTPMGEKVVFSDSMIAHEHLPEHPEQSTFLFHTPTGMHHDHALDTIQFFSCKKDHTPGKIQLKDYNYAKPDLNLHVSATLPGTDGPETEYLYGEHYFGHSDGKTLLKLRSEEMLSRRERFNAVSNSPYFRPGYTFALKGHFQQKFDQDYLALEVRHSGKSMRAPWAGLSQHPEEQQIPYQSQVVAVPASVQYRPHRRTKTPRILGLLSAKIDAAGSGKYAELDEEGRYKLKLPFDLEERRDGGHSSWVRMMQPYAGSDHGMHFPLHKDAEVLLSHIDGHPDRPIIVAAAPNPDNPSLVTEKNPSGNLLTSSGQNKLHMEDQKSGESIYLESPTMSTGLRIGSPSGSGSGVEGITMETQGDSTISVNQNEITQIGGTQESSVSGNRSKNVMGNNTETVHGDTDQTFETTYTLTALDAVTRNFSGGRRMVTPKRTRLMNNVLITSDSIQQISGTTEEVSLKELYKSDNSIELVGGFSCEANGASCSYTFFEFKYSSASAGAVGASASYTTANWNIHDTKVDVVLVDFGLAALIKVGAYKKKLGMTLCKIAFLAIESDDKSKKTEIDGVKIGASAQQNAVQATKHDN